MKAFFQAFIPLCLFISVALTPFYLVKRETVDENISFDEITTVTSQDPTKIDPTSTTMITTASPSEKDPCSPNPCLNHGSCSVNANVILGYSCFCRDYYTGHNCETCPSYCKEKWVIRYIQQPEKDIHYREMKAHCANRAGENDSDTGYPAFFRSNYDYNQYQRNNTDGRREFLGLS